MTTRPRLLLLDACAILAALETGHWALLCQKYEVVVTETIVEEVQGYTHPQLGWQAVDLRADALAGHLRIAEVSLSSITAFLAPLHNQLRDRLHAGEIEALALLAGGSLRGCGFVTGDGAAIVATVAYGMDDRLRPLDKIFAAVGVTVRVREDVSEAKLVDQRRRAGIEVASGRVLKGPLLLNVSQDEDLAS